MHIATYTIIHFFITFKKVVSYETKISTSCFHQKLKFPPSDEENSGGGGGDSNFSP